MMPPPPPVQTTQWHTSDGQLLRPQRDEARQLARVVVVAAERPVGLQARGAEEHDGAADPLALERMQRLQVLGEDAQRPRVVAVEERLVLVGERCACDRGGHGSSRAAKSMKPRSTSVWMSCTLTRSPTSSPCEAPDDAPFGRRPRDAHPRPLVRRAGHDAAERRADARRQQQRRRGLAHLPLDLRRVVLLQRAMRGERGELRVAVRRAPPVERGLDEALRDEVGKAAVRRGRMRVVLHRQREVSRRRRARELRARTRPSPAA